LNSITNVKLLLLVIMKAYGGVDLLFYSLLTLALHGLIWQTSRYGSEERIPGVHEHKTGWAPEQDWALRREKTPLPWQGIEPRFLSSPVCILVTRLITFTEFRIL
jgi:hypothetical protein